LAGSPKKAEKRRATRAGQAGLSESRDASPRPPSKGFRFAEAFVEQGKAMDGAKNEPRSGPPSAGEDDWDDEQVRRFPRTPHLEDSRLQPGDSNKEALKLRSLRGAWVVAEEKADGANSAVSFDRQMRLRLQSRGHWLDGGPGERQFDLLKAWAATAEPFLRERLGERLIMYGEWMAAKHSVYYDRLPHLFLEFDLFDKERGVFLSTPKRREILAGAPFPSVPVLHEGLAPRSMKPLKELIRPSQFKSAEWRANFENAARAAGVPLELAWQQTDSSDLMEGLYLKMERGDEVVGRAKWVRPDFVQTIIESGSHWKERPLIANALAPGRDLFADAHAFWGAQFAAPAAAPGRPRCAR
jgi:hypothetical protein